MITQLKTAEASYTTADLRRGLLSDLDSLRAGELPASVARTRAYVAKQVIDTMKLELAAQALQLSSIHSIPLLG